jgi:hypothetical protein
VGEVRRQVIHRNHRIGQALPPVHLHKAATAVVAVKAAVLADLVDDNKI